jgi:hypothetical protein
MSDRTPGPPCKLGKMWADAPILLLPRDALVCAANFNCREIRPPLPFLTNCGGAARNNSIGKVRTVRYFFKVAEVSWYCAQAVSCNDLATSAGIVSGAASPTALRPVKTL